MLLSTFSGYAETSYSSIPKSLDTFIKTCTAENVLETSPWQSMNASVAYKIVYLFQDYF